MALFVDFVGLNTLVEEPVDVNTNTVGNFSESRASGSTLLNAGRGTGEPPLADFAFYGPFPDGELRNRTTALPTRDGPGYIINGADYLTALNLHRNGPYGYPIFKQLRAGQSPIIRRQRLTNIFSHYEFPGETLTFEDGRNTPNFSFISFTKLPPVNSSLAITFGAATKTVEFTNSGTMESDFSGDNKLNIKLDDSSLTSLKSDHDRTRAIADRIGGAIKELGLTDLGRVSVSSSPFLYSQAVIFITAKANGPDGLSITTVATNQPDTRISNRGGTLEKISRVVPQRRGPVEHYNEVPVVSRHKPLRMIGSVTTLDPDTNKDVLERVDVFTTLGNETAHFSNGKLNKFYGTEGLVSEDYEDFVDLYLEGGVDGDESPIDEFRYLSYRQDVYPKEIYTYKNHTRNRINFISRYWRDTRKNRTETDVDNGFGFSVHSQSVWVLDGEQDFKNLTYQISPGQLFLRHPNHFRKKISIVSGTIDSTSFKAGKLGADDGGSAHNSVPSSASTETFTFPDSGTGHSNERSISHFPLGDKRLVLPTIHATEQPKYVPIAGIGGYPNARPPTLYGADDEFVKQYISINPYDISVEALWRYASDENGGSYGGATAGTLVVNDNGSAGLRKAFETRGFSLGSADEGNEPTLHKSNCRLYRVDLDRNRGLAIMSPEYSTTSNADKNEWRLKTTASTIATWIAPNPSNIPGSATVTNFEQKMMQLSGTLYHETVTVTPIGGGDTETKVSKIINFDPERGGVTVKLGTVFSGSLVQGRAGSDTASRLFYIGADEPGAVEYKTNSFYDVDNPIYHAAKNWNPNLRSGDGDSDNANRARFVAATSLNHFAAELDLSGSHPALGLASSFASGQSSPNSRDEKVLARGQHFIANHAHDNNASPKRRQKDPNGYARIYVNGSSSYVATQYDPYNFLEGSNAQYQEQLSGSNASIKLKNIGSSRSSYHLKTEEFVSINPFNSNGFSFSYWINWGEDPDAYSSQLNPIFVIQDEDGVPIIDHTIGGYGADAADPEHIVRVGFRNSDGEISVFKGVRNAGWAANAWYNVTFSLKNNAGTMEADVKILRKNWTTESTGWASKTFDTTGAQVTLTPSRWAKIKKSGKLFVLPAGTSFSLLRDTYPTPKAGTNLDNVSIDGLAFWNGGLSSHQMLSMLSSSVNTNDDGYVGDGPPSMDPTRFPGTDTSIALESVGGTPTLRHARRLYEMNTHQNSPGIRKAYEDIRAGRCYQRGDKYYPLGVNHTPALFQSQVLDAGTAGQMDYCFWFKASHQNFRNRSLRYIENAANTEHPMVFNSNLSNRRDQHKGFLISFWWRRNGSYSTTKHTNILSCAQQRWGVCVTPDSTAINGETRGQRKLCLWFNADPNWRGYQNVHKSGGVHVKQSIFVSGDQLPNDNEFHHCVVCWNGKIGLESTVYFSIDGERTLEPDPLLIYNDSYNSQFKADTPLGVLGQQPDGTAILDFGDNTIGDFKHGINVINPCPTFELHGQAFETKNCNIAQLCVIDDPPDVFISRTKLVDKLYNSGQRALIGNGEEGIDATERIADSLDDIGGDTDGVMTYAPGYSGYNGSRWNADGQLINKVAQQNFATYPHQYWYKNSYNFNQSALLPMLVSETSKPYFKLDFPHTNGMPKINVARAGGWTVTFDFFPGNDLRYNQTPLVDNNEDVTLIRFNCKDGERLFSLFRPANEGDDLWGYCRWSNGKTGKYVFKNVQSRLFDGDAHSIMFTTTMMCNAAGKPVNANLFIDNEMAAVAHETTSNKPSSAQDINDTNNPKSITLFANHLGNNTMPATFYFSRLKVFRQYYGGADTDSIALRKRLTTCNPNGIGDGFSSRDNSGTNDAGVAEIITGQGRNMTGNRPSERVRDNSFMLTEETLGNSATITMALEIPGHTRTEFTNVEALMPAVVDCPLANFSSGDIINTTGNSITVRNTAFKQPKITHYYRLGSEKELQDVQLFERLKNPLLTNRREQGGATGTMTVGQEPLSTHGTYLSGSQMTILDSGPRHWNVDNWGGGTGDVDSNGIEQARNAQQREQTLFFVGDHRDQDHPRNSYGGIELSLSASGGGYHLISAIGTTPGSNNRVRRSEENLIIPDRWYFVYAQYAGLTGGGTVQDNIYLNGKLVTFPTTLQDSTSPATTFDTLATATNSFPLSLGGIRGKNMFGFSGFIQDFALWDRNQTTDTNGDGVPDIANSGRNTWDGVRGGSSYIDTDNAQLLLASKMGYLEGNPSAKIKKVAGSLTPVGGVSNAFSSTNRAYITGPPIEWYRSTKGGALDDNGGTIVSFWASMSSTNEKGIVGFNSDIRFPVDFYKQFGDLTLDYRDDQVDYTDTSAAVLNDLSTHRRLRISMKKNSTGGAYTLYVRSAGLLDNGDILTSYTRSDHVLFRSEALVQDTGVVAAPPLNTLFHNTIMMTKDAVRWYMNGTIVASLPFDNTNTDLSNKLEQQYPLNNLGSNPTWKQFLNGWNNISLLEEDDAFSAGSKIDEVAVLFYDNLSTQTDSQRNATATALYNGGMVFDYSGRKDNLYAWWRMGENNLNDAPFVVDSNVSANSQIDDESERPAHVRNHLNVTHGATLKAVQRTGLGNSDLKNYYKFNRTDANNSAIPFGRAPGTVSDANNRDIDCSINTPNQKLSFQGTIGNWEWNYSFDSYKLYPFGWLATEGMPSEAYLLGRDYTDGNTRGVGRLRYDYGGGSAGYKRTNSWASIADTAIFTGVSNHYGHVGRDDDTCQAKAVTTIRFGVELPDPTDDDVANPPVTALVGDTLVLVVNPREVAGGGVAKDGNFRELRIEFTRAGGTSTAFTNPTWTSRPNVRIAKIDITADGTIPDILDALQTLLTDSSNNHGLRHASDQYWSVTHDDATRTLTLTSQSPADAPANMGGDGKWEIIGKYEGQGNDKRRVDISSTVGVSHISKALTRGPGFGWVQQNDSDFTRGTYTNTFLNGTSGSHGLMPTMVGSTPVVKPYWYQLETTDHARTKVGDFNTNIGTSIGKFNIVNPDSKNDYGWLTQYTSYPLIDSGSMIQMAIKNTPQLDFNDIRIHSGSFLSVNMSGSTTNFQSPRAPKALIGGATGARAGFGPGVLQNSYSQFAQTIEQGSTKFIDHQLSASACYFRRHSLTGSKSFVASHSGFLQKLSASQDDSNYSTVLLGDISASHLFLGSAKWEAGDFAGYYNDAGTFEFKSKKPFFDDYGKFIEEARPLMKDYGVVPEFRISDHVTSYLTRGPTEQKLDFLNITGGLASADTSNKKDFFEIYSTTDFLKHFEMVQDDHSDFVDPFAIRLRCSVVKKFLPYEGFYPAQRTVQVAEQFHKSYAANVNITASLNADGSKKYNLSTDRDYGFQYLLAPLYAPGIMYNTIKSGVAVDYPLITDTGSVKRLRYYSGTELVAGGAMITEQFDTRIPFEALIEPEKHLANITLASNEPDENGQTDLEVEWGGEGDQLYNLMISNFLAETSEFFLENKSFTSLASLSQGDPNFGNAKAGNIYMMRLKMFRSTTGQKGSQKNRLSKSYGVPQDQGSMQETFTMYSRPSAFGPPQLLSGSGLTANTWSDFKFDGTSGSLYIDTDDNPFRNLKPVPFQHDFSYVTGSTYGYDNDGHEAVGNQAHLGENYPFTPPYYHGEAWADITFIPTQSKKYTLQEIINQSSVEFYRYFAGAGTIKPDGFTPITHDTQTGAERTGDRLAALRGVAPFTTHPNRQGTLSHVHDRTVVINDQAMQIASSVNIFSQGVLEQDISAQTATGITNTTNVQVDTDLTNKYRWIIQTKFETPMLNFNRYTYGKHTTGDTNANGTVRKAPHRDGGDPVVTLPNYTDNSYGIELPGVAPMQTPIGMWHQYGHLPQNAKEGVFLQVDDVPRSWIRNAMHRTLPMAKRHRSLADLCGFSTEPVRMGEVAGVKEISEAVVAIPFFEKGGRRRFFTMEKRQVRLALDPSRKNLVGRTVIDMVEKMQKFVIPPSLDFVTNPEIRPFSMYIFEFNHNLTKQDLSDIWQNLPPELNQTVQTDEVSISHQLLAYELLGKGGRYRRGRNQEVELVRNDRAESVNPEIQWMVFKVKQRAKTNYFEKIFARNESQQLLSQRVKLGVSADALGKKNRISYNWPYDFFSMIEGVKLNAEVHFLDFDEEASQAQEKPVIKPKTKDTTKDREQRTAPSRRLLGAVSGKVPPNKLKKPVEEVDKKPKRKKGKITRKRRVKTVIKKPSTQKKKLNNAFDRKKIK